MAETAQQLARAWGDQSERGRMQSDMTVKLAEPPRGLGIMSGEEVPDIGESGIARFYVVDIQQGDVPVSDTLTQLQAAARKGLLAQAMRGFIQYIQPQASALPERLAASFEAYRAEAIRRMPGAHGRTHESIAWLMIGASCMLGFWASQGAITGEDARALSTGIMAALLENAGEQQKSLRGENPVGLFINGLRELLATRAVYLMNTGTNDTYQAGDVLSNRMGDLVGYVDPQTSSPWLMYLLPQVVYGAVQRLFKEQGSIFPISRPQLWKRFREQGLLITRQGVKGEEMTPTKCVGGCSQRMVWLRAADVFGDNQQMEV